ncbi:MAG TPA: hypothetical protein H9912_05125, partial [Candidatus Eisenbergiella stercorigallinarum]|nr:hypothetical protein [Candidatus Eisenbergiella stercorigallinarum]
RVVPEKKETLSNWLHFWLHSEFEGAGTPSFPGFFVSEFSSSANGKIVGAASSSYRYTVVRSLAGSTI